MSNVFFYRPQTKLCQGNVSTGICLFTGGRGDPMWPLPIMHRTTLYLQPPPTCNLVPPLPPPPDMGPGYLPLCYWHLEVITGDLFKLVHLITYPPPRTPPLVATETCKVGKRAYTSYWNVVLFCTYLYHRNSNLTSVYFSSLEIIISCVGGFVLKQINMITYP